VHRLLILNSDILLRRYKQFRTNKTDFILIFLLISSNIKNGGPVCSVAKSQPKCIFIHGLSDSRQMVKFKATDAMTSQPHRHVSLGMTNHCLLLSTNSLVRLAVISPLHCGSVHKKAGRNSD